MHLFISIRSTRLLFSGYKSLNISPYFNCTMRIYHINTKNAIYAVGLFPRKFWFESWKPKWHNGRGKYFTFGLWLISIYRGY